MREVDEEYAFLCLNPISAPSVLEVKLNLTSSYSSVLASSHTPLTDHNDSQWHLVSGKEMISAVHVIASFCSVQVLEECHTYLQSCERPGSWYPNFPKVPAGKTTTFQLIPLTFGGSQKLYESRLFKTFDTAGSTGTQETVNKFLYL